MSRASSRSWRLGERRPHRRDDRCEAGLPQREHVGVPLDDDAPVLARDRLPRGVEPVEEVAFAEQLALGRVDVLRLQRIVVVELPRLEATDAAARVGEREDDAPVEVVVTAAVRKPDRAELVLGIALLQRAGPEPRPAGRVTEPKLTADLLAELTGGEVVARRSTRLRLPEHACVELGRPLEQRAQPLVAAALLLLLGRRLLVFELDPEPSREQLDRADEVEVLGLLDEGDRVAALATAEALERAAGGRDGEARRPLGVEGTEALVRAPRLAETDDVLDDREDLHRRLDALDRLVLDACHGPSRALPRS